MISLRGTWRNADDVPLESLPRPCVLKPTAASGAVTFTHESESLNLADTRAAMRRWLRRTTVDCYVIDGRPYVHQTREAPVSSASFPLVRCNARQLLERHTG